MLDKRDIVLEKKNINERKKKILIIKIKKSAHKRTQAHTRTHTHTKKKTYLWPGELLYGHGSRCGKAGGLQGVVKGEGIVRG